MPGTPAVTAAGLLAAALGRLYGRPVRVMELTARPLDHYSTHPIERLRATLDDGTTLEAIFKRIEAGGEPDSRREREVLLYERLLAGGRFGAPALYGSHFDPSAGRYWLLLEDVGDWKLEYSGIGDWRAAFQWLAQTHADQQGREAELRALDCLAEHDAAFYKGLHGAARAQLARRATPEALARFDRLMAELDRPINELVAQPRSLVHGDLSCHNLVVQPERTIRPLDWEWAAVGPPAWDVARLASGWGAKKASLVELYCDTFDRWSTTPLDRRAFARSLDLCEIFQICWYLRWWIASCHKPAFVDEQLASLERRLRRLYGEGANG